MSNLESYDFRQNDIFIENCTATFWKLIDCVETKSVIVPNSKLKIFVHLYNQNTKKVKRIEYLNFVSNFTKVESSLAEEVLFLTKCFENSSAVSDEKADNI